MSFPTTPDLQSENKFKKGLQIQRIQELGYHIPVTVCRLYAFNEYIRKVRVNFGAKSLQYKLIFNSDNSKIL